MRQQMQEIEEALATARHAGLDKTEATKAAPEASEDGLSSNAKAQVLIRRLHCTLRCIVTYAMGRV